MLEKQKRKAEEIAKREDDMYSRLKTDDDVIQGMKADAYKIRSCPYPKSITRKNSNL